MPLIPGTLNHSAAFQRIMRGTGARGFLITGVLGLLVDEDGVDVVGLDQSRFMAPYMTSLSSARKDALYALGAVSLDKVLEDSAILGLFYVDVSWRPAIKKGAQESSFGTLAKLISFSLLCDL